MCYNASLILMLREKYVRKPLFKKGVCMFMSWSDIKVSYPSKFKVICRTSRMPYFVRRKTIMLLGVSGKKCFTKINYFPRLAITPPSLYFIIRHLVVLDKFMADFRAAHKDKLFGKWQIVKPGSSQFYASRRSRERLGDGGEGDITCLC